MASVNKSNIVNAGLVKMRPPVSLQTDEFVQWSNGKGTDVWAMIHASVTGDLKKIKELVAKDANLLNCSFEYLNPIRFAVRENHKEVVEYFLEQGVSPMNEFGDSILTIAKDRGYDDLVALLTTKLKELYHISGEGDKLPELIRAFDKQGVKDIIIENPELLHTADARGNLPLHWAALTRQMDLLEWFLEQGADINARRPDGAAAIDLTFGDYHYRSWYRDLPPTGLQKHELLIGYLIAKGAYYDISVAAKMGHYERVKELLDKDPSLANQLPVHCGYYSSMPIRNAAGGGFYEIVKLLLERGANPNRPEPGVGPKGTALHTAISRKHWNIVRLLLENGADANADVESSGNILWMAKYIGAPQEIIDLIISYGGKLTVELICYDDDVDGLSQLLAVNPQLSFNEDEHRVILEKRSLVELVLKYQPEILKRFSIRGFNDPELAKWLIKNGLNPNNTDWLGATPLHRAASDGNIEMAAVYLEADADLNAVDSDLYSTPLGWAARSGKKEMVEWLLQKGADPSLPQDELWAKPAAWAKRKGHHEIEKILMK